MNTPSFDRELLLSLAADYADGTCTRADAERLEAMLRADGGARRLFVDYCMLSGQLPLTTAAVGPSGRKGLAPRIAGAGAESGGRAGGNAGIRTAAAVAAASIAACLAVVVAASRSGRDTATGGGFYDNRQLPVVTVASLRDGVTARQPLTPSTLRPVKATGLVSTSGADVNISEAAIFGVTTADAGTLYDGAVRARLTTPDANFSVTTSNLRIVDKGTAFSVERIDDDHVRVTVLDGEVEVQSRTRLPVCYWPFDDIDSSEERPRATDIVGGLSAVLDVGATPCRGIVGAGAVRFDGVPSATARIKGGTGERVGTGGLSTAEGITLEAMIMSHWSGGFRDYDEIYRKEDGTCRVLLALQNDRIAYDEPDVPAGPCLSFGLHLAGRGYAELDMPLDGKDGRPSLAEFTDGRPHHVVAAYDSFSGRKTIFIDGVRRFEHVYPVGTLILSGGPAVAEIGNTKGREPFNGVIDEFAFYDFAVTDAEVADHHRRASSGGNYFGSDVPVAGSARWQPVTRLIEGQAVTFNRRTGLKDSPVNGTSSTMSSGISEPMSGW
jgi:hypothetical protein